MWKLLKRTIELTPRTATDRTEPKENQKVKKQATQKLFRIRSTFDTLQEKLMRLQWISWNVTAQ